MLSGRIVYMRNAYFDMLRRRIIMQMRNRALCVRKTHARVFLQKRIHVADENIYGEIRDDYWFSARSQLLHFSGLSYTIQTRPITDMRFYRPH